MQMVQGCVTGSIVSTRKVQSLIGCKLMLVAVDHGHTKETIVAVDQVGAGIGDEVLVATGSPARFAMPDENTPVDAVIVGIIDQDTRR